MGWQRFNRTTNVFEVSDNNGQTWQTLVIAAAGLGTPALPANIAYTNVANVFTQIQELPGSNPALRFGGATAGHVALRFGAGPQLEVVSADTPSSVWMPIKAHHFVSYTVGNDFGDLTVNGAVDLKSNVTIRGPVVMIGGAGTAYAGGPLEIQMGSHPRVSFHWPGIVAASIGMDSAGWIRTYDNPGTGVAPFVCGRLVAQGGITPRILQLGGTNYIAPNENLYDIISIWALNQTLTIGAGGGSWDGFPWTLRIRDDGVARALSWDGNYMSVCGVALPTQTAPSRTIHIGFRWNVYYGRWQMIALAQE